MTVNVYILLQEKNLYIHVRVSYEIKYLLRMLCVMFKMVIISLNDELVCMKTTSTYAFEKLGQLIYGWYLIS